MLELLRELHNQSQASLAAARFDQANQQHRLVVSLHARIIELADSAIFLISDRRWTGVDILLRSALEALVDLINLANDPSYIAEMQANCDYSFCKLIGGAAGENAFLQAVRNKPHVIEIYQRHKAGWEQWQRENQTRQPPSIRSKFERAGFLDVYVSVYNSLSSEGHNNIRTLIERHVSVHSDETDFEIQIFAEPSAESQLFSIDSLIGVLLRSALIFHRFLETGEDALFQTFSERRTEGLTAVEADDPGADWI